MSPKNEPNIPVASSSAAATDTVTPAPAEREVLSAPLLTVTPPGEAVAGEAVDSANVVVSISSLPRLDSTLSPDVQRVLSVIKTCVINLKVIRDRALAIAGSLESSGMLPAEQRANREELTAQVEDFAEMKSLTRAFHGAMRLCIDAEVGGDVKVCGEMKRVVSTAAAVRQSVEADNDFNRPMRELLGMSSSLQKALEPKHVATITAAEERLFTMLDGMVRRLEAISQVLSRGETMRMTAAALTAELMRVSELTGDDAITVEEAREMQQRRYLRKIKNALRLFVMKMEAVSRSVDADFGPGLWMLQSKKPCCGELVVFAVEAGLSAGVDELVRALEGIKAAYLADSGVKDEHIKALRKACQKFYQLPLEKILGVEAGSSEDTAIVACRSKLEELLFAETLPDKCEKLLKESPRERVLISCLGASSGAGLVPIFTTFTAAMDWRTQASKWLAEIAVLLPSILKVLQGLPKESEEAAVLLKQHNLLFARSVNIRLHAAAYGVLSPADMRQVVTSTACLREAAVVAVAQKYECMDSAQLNQLGFDEVFQEVPAAAVSELKKVSSDHATLLKLIPLSVQALTTMERMQGGKLEFDTITSHYENICRSLGSYEERIKQVVDNVVMMLKSGWGSKANLMVLPGKLRDALASINDYVEALGLFCQDLKLWRGFSDEAAPVRAIGEVTDALTKQRVAIEGLLVQFRDKSAKIPETCRGDSVGRETSAGSEGASIVSNTALVEEFRSTIQASLTDTVSNGGMFSGSRLDATVGATAASLTPSPAVQ